MKICNCVLPHTSGTDICKNCGNNNEYPEMVSNVYPPLYGNSTAMINIDYYEELKSKADKWVEKETPLQPRKSKKEYFCWCPNKNCDEMLDKVQKQNYCYNCGQKLDWESDDNKHD